jgi:hypothetical protein
MLASSIHAQATIIALIEAYQIAKETYNSLKKADDKAKVDALKSVFDKWSREQESYMKKTGKVGDCKDIYFMPPNAKATIPGKIPTPSNYFSDSNFSFECGKRQGKGGDSTAYINVKTKQKIGDCPAGVTTFSAKINYVEGYVTLDLEPLTAACVFFDAVPLTQTQKTNRAKEVQQWRTQAQKTETAKSSANIVSNSSSTNTRCKDSQNRDLYCNWDSGCYAIDPRYADPPGGTCASHVENCQKWGALYIGVKREGAGVKCASSGGTPVR